LHTLLDDDHTEEGVYTMLYAGDALQADCRSRQYQKDDDEQYP
jgi:hypothetical protein